MSVQTLDLNLAELGTSQSFPRRAFLAFSLLSLSL